MRCGTATELRRFDASAYGVPTVYRERVTEIQRPDWWPTEEEVKQALEPEAAIVRSYGEGAHRGNGRAMEGERS